MKINYAYIVALSSLIFFAVGRIVKVVVEKQELRNTKNIRIANPRGRKINIGFEFSDDTKLVQTILVCIADNKCYFIKDPEIIKVVFVLIKVKIKKESLVLTPNMICFLALKLINNDQTLIVKIKNFIASSNNRAWLFAQVTKATTVRLL